MLSDTRIKSQIISLLGINARGNTGVKIYGTEIGDEAYLSDQIDTAIEYAKLEVGEAIADTDGHSDTFIFVSNVAVAHGAQIPAHKGLHGVPRITPFEDADYTIEGRTNSYEKIDAYRRNPEFRGEKLYGEFNHDEPDDGGRASKLAGFFAVVQNILYYTGFSAEIPLKTVTLAKVNNLSSEYEPKIADIAIGKLYMDGSISEIFSHYQQLGLMRLNQIRTGEITAPSTKPALGTRDVGTK
jgi:hypothetical protein